MGLIFYNYDYGFKNGMTTVISWDHNNHSVLISLWKCREVYGRYITIRLSA